MWFLLSREFICLLNADVEWFACSSRGEEAMTMKKRVVVIGGGVGGTAVAKKLEQEADVTLIDP